LGTVRFLQVSDLRFGAVPPLPELEIDNRIRRILIEDQRRVLERVIQLTEEHRADMVLIAGDLLDDAHATPEDADLVIRALGALAPRPVVVAPGLLDPPHPASYLSPEVLELMGKAPLPSNIMVFRATTPATMLAAGVAVTGWAVPPRALPASDEHGAPAVLRGASPNALGPTPPGAHHHVLLAHQGGSVFPALPTPQQLIAAGIHYMALGHDEASLLMRDQDGIVRIAWAGHPFPHRMSGRAAGGILIGQIDDLGVVSVELVDTGARRAHAIECDVTGLADSAELVAHLRQLLPDRGVRPQDLALVRLTGAWSSTRSPALKKRALDPTCAHLRLDLTELVLAFSPGPTVRDLHRAGLIPRAGDARATMHLEALRLVDAAWEGGEVSPSGENPADPV
jgi:hypothetical protein